MTRSTRSVIPFSGTLDEKSSNQFESTTNCVIPAIEAVARPTKLTRTARRFRTTKRASAASASFT